MSNPVDIHMQSLRDTAQSSLHRCKTNADAIAVGCCLLQLAETILESTMTAKGAAEMLYAAADKLATKE